MTPTTLRLLRSLLDAEFDRLRWNNGTQAEVDAVEAARKDLRDMQELSPAPIEMIQAARTRYQEVEFDDNAMLSPGSTEGKWLQCWAWIEDEKEAA